MKRLATTNQQRRQVDANTTCPKERAINLRSSSSCGESSISIMSKQTSSNMRSFNWRSNWETLLVFVIIVVGIVITTIAAIRSKDKHLLVISDDQSGGNDFGGDSSASSRVPPLPPTDFQLSGGGGGGGIGDGEPPPSSLATRQKSAHRLATQIQRTTKTQKDSSASANSAPIDSRESYGDDANSADDFHATRSSLAPPQVGGDSGGDAVEPTASTPRPPSPSNMHGPYQLGPPIASTTGVQRPPNRPVPPVHSGGGRASQLKLAPQQPAEHQSHLQVHEQQTQQPALPIPIPIPPPPPTPPPFIPEISDDMMTSYTRLPHQSSTNQSSTYGLRDYNANPNSTAFAGNNKVQIVELTDAGDNEQPRQPNQHHPTHQRAPMLPFSLLLNDLIRMARPTSALNSVGSAQSPGGGGGGGSGSGSGSLEQPANNLTPGSNYGILQQMQSSFPAPLMAVLQGAGSPESVARQQAANHDASESSHYQRISMSPSESLGMMLSRTLRATNPLPAFPPPKGIPQAWVHPNSGGTSVLNDAVSNNADFVAGNAAGFLRADSLASSASAGSSPDQEDPQPIGGQHQQQHQQQSSSEQHQGQAADHPSIDDTDTGSIGRQQQQQMIGANGQQQQQQQQVSAPDTNFMQPPSRQQGARQSVQMIRPATLDTANPKMDDSYRAFKSAGALGFHQQQHQQQQPFQQPQQQLVQYPSIQNQQQQQRLQMTFNNLQNGPPASNQISWSQGQPRFANTIAGNILDPFTSGLSLSEQDLQQQHKNPVYNSGQIFSEIHEPSAHVPLGYSMPQQRHSQQQQQQQQVQNVPIHSPLLDFNVAPGLESAPKVSISDGGGGGGGESPVVKTAGYSSRQSGQPQVVRMQQHHQQTKSTESNRKGSSPTNFGGQQQQPITLNAINRMRRSLSHGKSKDENKSNTRAGDENPQQADDEEEEYLDSRPLSVVSPDGRPMSELAVKLMRQLPDESRKSTSTSTSKQTAELSLSSHRQANHLDDDEAPLHHYASGSGAHVAPHSKSGARKRPPSPTSEQDQPYKLVEKIPRRAKSRRRKLLSKQQNQVDKSVRATGAKAKHGTRERAKSSAMHMDTASSGLMSKLLGTASTNDEHEEDPDSDGGARGGGGGGGDDDDDDGDESSAQERRKEELEDAEFGIVSERPNRVAPAVSENNELANNLNSPINEMSRLTRGEPSGQTGNNSPGQEPSMGSTGGNGDNNAYASRRQQHQQTRSDVEFYGHPGEETRQLKYGILGSGNYEVVNGGIYPDTEESTAAVNSVANYVRKPSMQLLAAAAGLPKLLGATTSGGQQQQQQYSGGPGAGFMPGDRLGGFMRGASVASAEEMAGIFPPQTVAGSNPLLDMLSAAHVANGGYPFDASLMSQLGESDTSARTTHTSQDQVMGAGEQDELHQQSSHKNQRKRSKLRAKLTESQQLDAVEHVRNSARIRPAASIGGGGGGGGGGGSRDTMQPMESLSDGPNNRIRSASSTSDESRAAPASTKSQLGINQFYSYQLLPSKKVTIFSDQDLDSAPSEQRLRQRPAHIRNSSRFSRVTRGSLADRSVARNSDEG